MKTVLLENAAKNIRDIFSKAHEGEVKIVMPNGEAIVLLSYDNFRAMQIRLDLANDTEDLIEIMDARNRFQEGNLEGFEDVRALLEEYGFK